MKSFGSIYRDSMAANKILQEKKKCVRQGKNILKIQGLLNTI